MTNSIRTCLWFRDGRGREVAAFYCSLISGSRVERALSLGGANSIIDFTLGGVPYQILDAGPHFTLTEAASISVETDDQDYGDSARNLLTCWITVTVHETCSRAGSNLVCLLRVPPASLVAA